MKDYFCRINTDSVRNNNFYKEYLKKLNDLPSDKKKQISVILVDQEKDLRTLLMDSDTKIVVQEQTRDKTQARSEDLILEYIQQMFLENKLKLNLDLDEQDSLSFGKKKTYNKADLKETKKPCLPGLGRSK